MAEETIPILIPDITHPLYTTRINQWFKWRTTYEGGDFFIHTYLQKFSRNESPTDFEVRTKITYVPAFAKAALVEVRNSIYQRLCDIARTGGSASWQDAVIGKSGGVDLLGSSMNTFMGTEVLEELLVMGKVGIYIDMPVQNGPTLANNNRGNRPYFYVYRTEDIRSWADDDTGAPGSFRALLLRDKVFQDDPKYKLPNGTIERFRYYWKEDDGSIWVQFFNSSSQPIPFQEGQSADPIRLNIPRIPFVVAELNNSLMIDIANYQIALLNLASTDMAYAVGANFPFYTEQYDPSAAPDHLKSPEIATLDAVTGNITISSNQNSISKEIAVGPTSGRLYAKDLNPPEYIHPSPEPLKASMEKQQQMKLEIRLLINLSISDIQPKMASAESKGMDTRTLESGLSYIGLVMEDAERQATEIWHEYERSAADFLVKYPEKYSLRDDKAVFAEVEELKKQMSAVASITYKRAISKRIVELLIAHRVTTEDLKAIYAEIDKAQVPEILIDKIEIDVQFGYLSRSLAAELRGYPKTDLAVAEKENLDRIQAIAVSQQKGGGTGALDNPAARGVPQADPNPTSPVEEKSKGQ